MEAQQSPLSGTPHVTSYIARKWLWKALRWPVSRSICVFALLIILVVSPASNAAQHVHAASVYPQECPTSPWPGAANCSGAVTAIGPVQLQPPGGPVFTWRSWRECVSEEWLRAWFFSESPEAGNYFIDYILGANGDWYGNWIVTMTRISGLLDVTNPVPYAYNAATPNGPYTPCPPPQPPPPTSTPEIQDTYFDFWAYAPVAVVSGSADCPDGSAAGAWCPPSVGKSVHLTVIAVDPAQGSRESCSGRITIPNLYWYTICMQWTLGGQVGGYTWNFDDAEVDPTTGQARQVSGVNYNVSSSLGQTVDHTFQYSSAFDPIRGCVRPCQGDLRGAPMPGYPQGTPAFQVQVASNWLLQVQECLYGACSGNWTTIDLTQFGSPTSYFTSVTTVPLFVVSYGSVTTS
jgi:hypothetical protein